MGKCMLCNGRGTLGKPGEDIGIICGGCNGTGYIQDDYGQDKFSLNTEKQTRLCFMCNGNGEVFGKKCGYCGGKGVVNF
jgi:DnaJ-class molecular chaperone